MSQSLNQNCTSDLLVKTSHNIRTTKYTTQHSIGTLNIIAYYALSVLTPWGRGTLKAAG